MNEIQTKGLEPVFPFLTSFWNFLNVCAAKNNVMYNSDYCHASISTDTWILKTDAPACQ